MLERQSFSMFLKTECFIAKFVELYWNSVGLSGYMPGSSFGGMNYFIFLLCFTFHETLSNLGIKVKSVADICWIHRKNKS